MRIAWIQASSMDESLAIADVAGVLRERGHPQRLFLDRHESDLVSAVVGWRPDVAVVQAAFMAEPWLAHVLASLPAGLPIVLVGSAATFDPSILARVGAPLAALGELDDVLPPLLDAIEAGTDTALPGTASLIDGEVQMQPWPDGPPALEPRPLPYRDLYFDPYPFLGTFPWKRFSTGRGCVHSCGFCYLPPLREAYGGSKANVRRKSVDRVLAEVEAVQSRWPIKRIHFADDLFAPSRAWLEEFAERWPREAGIPFTANTSPETVTEVNAALLGKAGARVIGIGLESGDETNRIEQLGRPTKTEAIRRAAARLQAHGIDLLTFNMIANPGEVLDDAMTTLELNQELGTVFPRVNLAYPTEGSHLQDLLRQAGHEPPPHDSSSRFERRAWCTPDDPVPFENLHRLFRLGVRWQVPPRVIRRVCRSMPRATLAPLVLYDAWVESRWTGVSAVDALRYARHAGPPAGRVTYHSSLP
jgi:anaerobic magnesium-protoporphyrin IX monomethyl ester cyclase